MIDLGTVMAVLAVLALVALIVLIAALWYTSPVLHPRSGTELSFVNPASGGRQDFPSLLRDPATVDLSLIVPAYNEEKRIDLMLEDALGVLEKRPAPFKYEVILVDDGSKDGTTAKGLDYVRKYGSDKIRVLTFTRNRGKGGAIRMGMLSARGKYLLFADADGATSFKDVVRLEDALKQHEAKNEHAMAIGSRAHMQDDAVANRTLLRNILMYGFHILVFLVGIRGIRDTQCGFKMFTRPAARVLFPAMHVERWCFDIELLFLALRLGYPVAETAVNWQEIDGSKLDPIWSSVQMFKDILLIRLYYLFGIWQLPRSMDAKKVK
ncbi:hypothetical protein CAOG_08434 [Capsaspora owczarzaki ATCC 30864]|uniref:dolichyl-phosphate beta-glucosyltransferase n=1 Tax=Capsaspora owczarzaki (strain ATCC 30864) TaxID=595528 RepID=A0A0D2WHN3_CAPO3|nr:hypothetical protein CAOG_08434 [Capsaspora owczarzaki ATCC 30864]KJE89135.1 hypothetical protein CAOG_008434 [Capsaspora owczarzaki ATCC 30864]|eukprot:XP_011270005.1 hypothetical protein CAOG_08434 [Capsaspora owczarzaki ATCC 30864]